MCSSRFLQKKGRAAHKDIEDYDITEVRFLTTANAVNEKCRQVQTKTPDQNDIFKFLANNPCVIYADLYESFFQNHMNPKDWGYMIINSPYMCILALPKVFSTKMKSIVNFCTRFWENLLMLGHCIKIADDLLIGGSDL